MACWTAVDPHVVAHARMVWGVLDRPLDTWAWVDVDDLAALIADVATGAVATADDAEPGPVAGGTTPVIVGGEPATWRNYLGTVTDAMGVAPEWTDEPAWTGQLLTDRARRWG
jgi:hypothetical protein